MRCAGGDQQIVCTLLFLGRHHHREPGRHHHLLTLQHNLCAAPHGVQVSIDDPAHRQRVGRVVVRGGLQRDRPVGTLSPIAYRYNIKGGLGEHAQLTHAPKEPGIEFIVRSDRKHFTAAIDQRDRTNVVPKTAKQPAARVVNPTRRDEPADRRAWPAPVQHGQSVAIVTQHVVEGPE